MNASHNNLREVEKKLREAKQGDKESGIPDLRKYIGTSYDFIGLTVPAQREVFKRGYSFSNSPVDHQLGIWGELWEKSSIYEVMTQAIFLRRKTRKIYLN